MCSSDLSKVRVHRAVEAPFRVVYHVHCHTVDVARLDTGYEKGMVSALHLEVAGLRVLQFGRDDDGAGAGSRETVVLARAFYILDHLRVDV